MKKIALFLSIFICLFLFTGCGASSMLVKENADGSIDVYYSVNLELEDLISANKITNEDVVEMKSRVEVKASELIAKCKAEYNFNLNKYYNNGALTKEQRLALVNQFNIYTGWTDNIYVVRFHFTTADAYKIYVNFGNDVEVKNFSQKSLFTTKHSQKLLNPFGRERDIFGGQTAFEYFNNLRAEYLNSHFSSDVVALFPELTMIYSYVSNESRLHSDADEIILTNAGYLHSWEINIDNFDKDIEFYTLSANPAVWYLLALTITFIIIAVYLVVIYFKKPKNSLKSLDFNL